MKTFEVYVRANGYVVKTKIVAEQLAELEMSWVLKTTS